MNTCLTMRKVSFTAVMRPAAPLAVAVASALTLVACATPVAKPSVEVHGQFAAASPENKDATSSDSEPEAAWWQRFGDRVLSDLIRRAAYENRDVRIAAERVRAARAGQTISRSSLFPSLSVVGGRTDQRTNYGAPIREKLPDVKAAGAGADVSWEIDLSGRLRAGAAAAAADTRAAEHGMRGVRLLVLTDVASNYFVLVGSPSSVRDRARDFDRAGRNAAPRIRATARRTRNAFRCRTCTGRRFECPRGDSAPGNARRHF